MTNRKNQNSILVLATLGVYLGLVLVGATPQILAQAAMTKQFNVKDEIEVKDDLDKKPDPTFSAPELTANYVNSVIRLVNSWSAKDLEDFSATMTGGLDDVELSSLFPATYRFFGDGTFSFKKGDHNAEFNFRFRKKGPDRPFHDFCSGFADELLSLRKIGKDLKQKVVASYTQIACDNDQVTVVTRLPRAGLDSLLAANAK